MSFHSAYHHGFLRVAACTLHDVDRRPGGQRRRRRARRARVPRRGRRPGRLPGADALRVLDRGPADAGRAARRGRDRAGGRGRGVRRPDAGARRRRAAAVAAPDLQHGGGRPRRPGARRRAQVVPADVPRVLRAPAGRAGRRRPRDDRARRRERAVRERPAVRGARRARLRPARGDLRGHVGAGAAERRGGARRRHRAREPLRQPDHDRPGRRPAAAVPVGVVPLPGGVRVRRRRRGRVHDGPVVGRPDDDLRERRPARRVRAVPAGAAAVGGRRRPRPAARRAAADGHVRRQPAAPRRAARRLPAGGADAGPAVRRHRAAAAGGAVPVRAGGRDAAGAGLLRGLQHPGLRARAADAGDRRAEGGHRRLRRARLDARADRRGEGDGPAGAAAQRHPRVHAAGVRDRRAHEAATRSG